MTRILLTPPFSNNTALRPGQDHLENILVPGLTRHGIGITGDPAQADWEVAGHRAGEGLSHHRLPRERVILVDGEVPQPEFLLPYYRAQGFAALVCPANKKAYTDCFPYYLPPEDDLPPPINTGRIVQLSTFRTHSAAWMEGVVNARHSWRYKVLCTLRCAVGLAIKKLRPEIIDIYGQGWPEGLVVENSRGGAFRGRKLDIIRNYSFDLCWENMEIPLYVSEKLWDPIRAGILPVYWGPPEMHELLPDDTVIDCREFSSETGFDILALLRTIESMSQEEYRDRVLRLRAWHRSLPVDAQRRSMVRAVDRLAREIKRLDQLKLFNAATPS